VKRVREALNNLPKSLDETYERILLSIDRDYRDVVLEALRWLCFSTRVLTVAELAEAAVFSAFVESPPEFTPLEVFFDKDNFFADPLDILGLLSGLVVCLPDPDSEDTDAITVLQDNDGTEHMPESRPRFYTTNSKVLLSHFSIKEYLVSGRLGRQVEHFAMDEVCSHQILATNCLYFILFSQEPGSSEEYPESYSKTERCFVAYAEINWVEHARKADYESRLVDLIVFILAAPHQLRAGFLEFLPDADYEGDSKDFSPLYLAAYGGLYFPCKQLIEKGADIDAQGGWCGSAIQAAIMTPKSESASESLRLSIVKLLLDHGANVQGGLFDPALHDASYYGHESLVKLLLDYGANVNAQGGYFGTALQAASNGGYESIVKLLLDHGANVNVQGGYFGTALQAASNGGYESIVKLLLDHGANVNVQGGHFGTALQAASNGGYESIVKLLLDHGANVNVQGVHFGTALHVASYFGHESIVKLLLDHGANVNARGGSLKRPLKAAVWGGRQKIVQLLLDHGAEVETEAGYYDEELIGDTYVRKRDIAVVLLEHGAVVSDFRGGVKAEEALERRDFRTFVDIQGEHLLEERKREREERRREPEERRKEREEEEREEEEREEEEIERIANEMERMERMERIERMVRMERMENSGRWKRGRRSVLRQINRNLSR
jgi:ankyrin repeat protein